MGCQWPFCNDFGCEHSGDTCPYVLRSCTFRAERVIRQRGGLANADASTAGRLSTVDQQMHQAGLTPFPAELEGAEKKARLTA
jgi:hypothetical protein